ncbi:hypothetical protein ENBRE01_0320 [Enteropsectra breve]|nr:hypothetical protein ENBRE01_0320 [Enteropsectra breve]
MIAKFLMLILARCITQEEAPAVSTELSNLAISKQQKDTVSCEVCKHVTTDDSKELEFFRSQAEKFSAVEETDANDLLVECMNTECDAKFHVSCIIGLFTRKVVPGCGKYTSFQCHKCQHNNVLCRIIPNLAKKYILKPNDSILSAINLSLTCTKMTLCDLLAHWPRLLLKRFSDTLLTSQSPCAPKFIAQMPLCTAIRQSQSVANKFEALKMFLNAVKYDDSKIEVDLKLKKNLQEHVTVKELENLIVDLAEYTKDIPECHTRLVLINKQIFDMFLEKSSQKKYYSFVYRLFMTRHAHCLLGIHLSDLKQIGICKGDFIISEFYKKINNPTHLHETLEYDTLYYSAMFLYQLSASTDSSGFEILPCILNNLSDCQKHNLSTKHYISDKSLIYNDILRRIPENEKAIPLYKSSNSEYKAGICQIINCEIFNCFASNFPSDEFSDLWKLFVFYERKTSNKPDVYLLLDAFTKYRAELNSEIKKLIWDLKRKKCFYELEILLRHSTNKFYLNSIISAFSNEQLSRIFKRKVHITPDTELLVFRMMKRCGYLELREDFFKIAMENYVCFTMFTEQEINSYFAENGKFSETGSLALAVTIPELLTGRSDKEIHEWCENFNICLEMNAISRNSLNKCQHLFIYLYVDPIMRYMENTLTAVRLDKRRLNILRMLEVALSHCKVHDVKPFICAIIKSSDAYFYLNAILLRSDKELKKKIMRFICSEISNEDKSADIAVFFKQVYSYIARYHETKMLLSPASDSALTSESLTRILQNIEELEKIATAHLVYDCFIDAGKNLIAVLEREYSEYWDKLKANISIIPNNIVVLLQSRLVNL